MSRFFVLTSGLILLAFSPNAAQAAEVQHLGTQTATASGAGSGGMPSIASYNIPSGKNRALFIWVSFERDHISPADTAAGYGTSGNTAGTGLGDNWPEPRIGTPPATTTNSQITAQVVGPGGTVSKKNALVIGGTPSGDLRFITISTSPTGSPAGTAFFGVSSFHIALLENEIQTLLGGAASGTVSITLPDVSTPSGAGDDAFIVASVFQNVDQTVTGVVRNGTATAQVVAGTPGNYSLAVAAYDAGQAPDEANDGKLVLGSSGSVDGFLALAGHTSLATVSITNAAGEYDTPNGNLVNEPNGFTGAAYFRNGGATPSSLYTLQAAGTASTLVYGGTTASFLLESDNADTGDAPVSYGLATHTISGIRLGATVDADASLLNNSSATGDDVSNTDDEDGVTIPASLARGASNTVALSIQNGSGFLSAWFDWNADGDFADAGEQIENDRAVTTGTVNLSVSVPAGATLGSTICRFRVASSAGLANTPGSAATSGEVEDYAVTITTPSNNADLSALSFSAGTLSPVFGAGTTAYSFTVPNATTSTTVTATRAEANATLQVRVNSGGLSSLTSGSESGALPLNVGANTVEVQVTAQDGSTLKSYITTITRASLVPVVTSSTANLAVNATTLTIIGSNFSATPGNNTVAFTPSGTGTITDSTTTSLTVTGITGLTLGALNAVVTTSGQSSGAAVQVATVVELGSLVVTQATDTTNATDGLTSLREAIAYATTLGGAQTITFSNTTAGGAVNFHDGTPRTIILGGTQLTVITDLTITGPGSARLSISGNNASRVFEYTIPGTATLSGVTVTGGRISSSGFVSGAGINKNSGMLVLLNCVISGNSLVSTAGITTGAAIHSPAGSLRVINCTVSGNTATAGTVAEGGGINFVGIGSGTFDLIGSTISGNVAQSSTAGGSFFASGGGVSVLGVFNGISSTISGNSCSGSATGGAQGGGIQLNSSAAQLMSGMTVTNNSVASLGNHWGGGVNGNATNITMVNSITADNSGPAPDFNGNVYVCRNSLIGDTSGLTFLLTDVNNLKNVAANLGTLQNNGGPTQTHALLDSSPAINAGDNAQIPADTFDLDGDSNTTEALPFDQRGSGFDRSIGTVDMGAFEAQELISIAALDASKAEGNTGTTNFTFTVSRSGATTGEVTADYAVSGAAVNAQDFGGTLPSGQVTIADGSASTTLSIPVSGDTLVEQNEAFTVTLSSPDGGYVLAENTATGTINNDDTAQVTISRTSHAAEQGSSNGEFQVSMTAPSSTDTVVSYTVAGTATGSNDYTALPGVVTITAGTTAANVPLTVVNDRAVEGTETVALTLTGTNNAAITAGTANQASLDITDNDTAVLSIVDPTVTVSESAGGTTLNLYIELITDGTGPEDQERNFQFRVVAKAASTTTAGIDFTLSSGYSLLAGGGSASVSAPTPTIIDDALVEGAETLVLGLELNGDLTGGQHSVSAATQTMTITDNDSVSVGFNVASSSEQEASTTTSAELALIYSTTGVGTPAMANDLTVNLSYAGSTATSGLDYTGVSSVQIPMNTAGSAVIPVQVTLMDDAIVEADETVNMTATLSSDPTNGQSAMGANDLHTLTILDNESATVSIAKVTDGEEGPPIVNGKFRITQTAVSSTNTVVNYSIGGTATPGPGNDYATLSGAATILAGQTTVDIDVIVQADAATGEPTETVTVAFSSFGAHDADITLGAPSSASLDITSGPILATSALGDVVSDNPAPGADGATNMGDFDVLRRSAYLGENGDLVFSGYMLVQAGPPVVTNNDFQGLWAKDAANPLRLIARSGSVAPGSSGAVFDILPEVPAISDGGDATFYASLRVGTGSPAVTATTDTGLWTTLSVLGANPMPVLAAREGSALRPPSSAVIAKFATGAYATSSASSGVIAFSATEADGKTGVYVMTMSGGLPQAAVTTAKQGNAAPGAGGEVWDNLASGLTDPARMDSAGNFTWAAKVKPSGKEGIWYAPIATGDAAKVVIAGDAAPGTTTTFSRFLNQPVMGGVNNIAFHAYVAATGDNAANTKADGVWKGVAPAAISTYTLAIRCGDTGVAGLPGGALVGNMWSPWMSNGNHIALRAWVDIDGNGFSGSGPDVTGLFTDADNTMRLVVKQGDAAPGIAGATFTFMDLPIIGGQEQMAFLGTVTGGGTTAANNQGIWLQAANGGALALVARTGDTVTTTQGVKTVSKLDFPGTSQPAFTADHRWEQRVMDGTGRMVIQATFTDGTTGQLFTP